MNPDSSTTPIASTTPVATPQPTQPVQSSPFINALNYAKQNPNSPFASELKQRIQSGQMNDQMKAAGIDVTRFVTAPPAPTPAPKQDGGIAGNFANDMQTSLQNRGTEFAQNIIQGAKGMSDANNPNQPGGANPLKAAAIGVGTGVHTAGTVAGGAMDILGAGIKALTPSPLKNWLSGIANNFATQTQQNPQAIGPQIISKITSEFQQHPELAHYASDAMNIIGLLATPSALTQTGKAIGGAKEAIGNAAGGIKDTFAGAKTAITGTPEEAASAKTWNIIKPKITDANAAAQEGSIKTTGLLRTTTQVPTEADRAMIDVAKPYVANAKSATEAIQNMQDGIATQAADLRAGLKGSGATWNVNDLKGAINKIESPDMIAADPTQTAIYNKVLSRVLTEAKDAPRTLDGLLDVRQGLDAQVARQGLVNYASEKITAWKQAITDIRDAINGQIESQLPEGVTPSGIDFRESLRNQTQLYRAIDQVQVPKVGSNILTRAASKIKEHPILSTVAGAEALKHIIP